MLPVNNFEPFGTAHLTTLCVIIALALALPLTMRFLVPTAKRPVAYLLAVLLLAQEGVIIWMRVRTQGLSAEVLPLQMCTLAVYLSAWMLVTQSRRIFAVVYFWGLGGTTQALLTPDLQEGFPALSFLLFFLGHGAVIMSIGYAMIVFGLRPYLGSLPRVMAITAGAAAVAFVVNLWLGTNFMYLMAKPVRPSLLDWFGPWPWYLFGLIAASVLAFVLLYSPFFVADLIKRTQFDKQK
jgi:hypothetical integral membrane protein (TIGR02206 family)